MLGCIQTAYPFSSLQQSRLSCDCQKLPLDFRKRLPVDARARHQHQIQRPLELTLVDAVTFPQQAPRPAPLDGAAYLRAADHAQPRAGTRRQSQPVGNQAPLRHTRASLSHPREVTSLPETRLAPEPQTCFIVRPHAAAITRASAACGQRAAGCAGYPARSCSSSGSETRAVVCAESLTVGIVAS